MKKIFLLILIFASVLKVQAQLPVTFYVQGDADDWQLFMSEKLILDLDMGGKVVIITLTAGDEGYSNTAFNGSPMAYYLAKERGGVYASKFVADYMNTPYPNTYTIPTAQTAVITGKSLVKYVYGNPNGIGSVVNYFLRLPDGNHSGAGFPGNANKSLKKLKENTISDITSVDGANTYTWAQLVNTILGIINAERGTDPQLWMNSANLNTAVNPNDHSDHIFSATAAQEAVAPLLWIGINEFIMDHSANLAENTNNEPYEDAAGAFNMYNWSLIKEKYPSQFTTTIRAWLKKEYISINRNPSGNGPLPISLLNFSGKLKGNNVLLDWTTSSEINSKEFQIERSDDGSNYRRLNSIPAAGNSSTTKTYSYLDVEATALNYYRLKMTDLDGSFKMSNVVIIKNTGATQDILYVTNPFADQINIRFKNVPKEKISVRLMDMAGKIMGTGVINSPLSSVIVFNDYSKSLSTGLYILQVSYEGKMYSYKLLKQ